VIVMVLICCEGPTCNNGISARDREAILTRGITGATVQTRDDAIRTARGDVSRALAVTPHEDAGVFRATAPVFVCQVCGFERLYGGNSLWGGR
jgi:hypothetical protein